MKFLFFFVALFFSVVSLATNSVLGWQKGVEEFVERDSSAFVVIENPKAILQQFEDSVFVQSRYVQRVLELLTHPEYPLLSDGDFDRLTNQWDNLQEELGKTDEIAIILHSWGTVDPETGNISDWFTSVPKVSCVIIGESDVNVSVAKALSAAIELLQGTMSLSKGQDLGAGDLSEGESTSVADNEADDRENETDVSYNGTFGMLFSDLSKLTVKNLGNAIVVSNDPKMSGELIRRMESSSNKTFRALSEQRTYKQIQKLLGEPEGPEIRGFIVPKNFPEYTTSLVTTNFYLSPKTLPAAGFKVSMFSDGEDIDTPDGTYRPTLSWNYVMTFTRPPTEFGQMIRSFEPLEEFPALPFSVTKLNAMGFDVSERAEAQQNIIEFHKMRERMKALTEEGHNSQGESEDEFPEEARYEDENSESFAQSDGSEDSEDVEYADFGDYEAYGPIAFLKKFKPGSVAGAIGGVFEASRKCKALEFMGNEGVRIYSVKDRAAIEEFFHNTIELENGYLGDGRNLVEVDCDQGTLFARDKEDVRLHWVESLEGLIEIPDPEALGDEIMCGEFEFFLNDQWMIHADHLTMRRLLEIFDGDDPTPQAFELILKNAKRESNEASFFKVQYESNLSNPNGLRNSIEADRMFQKYGDKEISLEKAFAVEPDECGLRNELESKNDVLAAVKQLITFAVRDAYGTSINLFSKGESNMRVFGQVYSLVD